MKTLSVMLLIFLAASCRGLEPKDIGVINNQLKPCPFSPNCVSSQAKKSDKIHYIAPFDYHTDEVHALENLRKSIESLEGSRIIKQSGVYIYAEFTTRTMRFIDDAEFLINSDKKTIDVRSASRVGFSDMNVNRSRIEAIRKQFNIQENQQ